MAAPSIFAAGSGSVKATGTTVALSGASSFSIGDYVYVTFTMPGTAGTVSFAKTAGTATIGSFTTIEDVSNGTSVRTVAAWAKVTAAGTITTITVTYPSVIPAAGEIWQVTGADGTTPVASHNSGTTAAPAVTAPGGQDLLAVGTAGDNAATATALTVSISGSGTWSAANSDTATSGTTGGGGTSNVSVGSAAWKATAVPSGSVSPSVTTASGTKSFISVLWQNTVAAPAGQLPQQLRQRQGARVSQAQPTRATYGR